MGAFSAVYSRVARLRRSWYAHRPQARHRLQRPVVSVGNLVVGGSGKTPVVATIARLLIAAGERPAILSRGYGRRGSDGVVVASDGQGILASAKQSGDEPAMLAAALPTVPIVVSADRYHAGALAERRFGVTVHLLDDGFQHLQLARDVDLLLVHPADLDDTVLPGGALREPHDAAASADAVLVAGTRDEAEETAAALGVRTMFTVEPRYGAARWLRGSPDGSPGPTGGRVVAVAGIARPERFFDALRTAGWDIAREMPFRDHRWFTPADHAAIAAAVRETGADGVITTEKDAVRLQGSDPSLQTGTQGTQELPVWAALPMTAVIEPEAPFVEWLLDRLRHAGHTMTGDSRPVRRSPEGAPELVRHSPEGEG